MSSRPAPQAWLWAGRRQRSRSPRRPRRVGAIRTSGPSRSGRLRSCASVVTRDHGWQVRRLEASGSLVTGAVEPPNLGLPPASPARITSCSMRRRRWAAMTMKEAIAHRPPLPGMSILGRLRDGIHRRRDHVVAREVVEVPDFLAGTIAVSGDFWHFSRTPAVVGSTPRWASTTRRSWAASSATPRTRSRRCPATSSPTSSRPLSRLRTSLRSCDTRPGVVPAGAQNLARPPTSMQSEPRSTPSRATQQSQALSTAAPLIPLNLLGHGAINERDHSQLPRIVRPLKPPIDELGRPSDVPGRCYPWA